MQLTLKRTKDGLLPLDDKAVEVISKLKIGEEILIEYKKNRNVKNHRRLFSLLQSVVHNQNHYKNVDNLLDVIKLKAGYFKTVVDHNGNALYIPESISFATLGEEEFKEFFSGAIDVILTFMPEESVNSILRYA